MKRILIGLIVGLLLLEAFRFLYKPPDDAAATGNAAYKAGDYARAEERFQHAEQAAPDSAVAAHNHAAALYRLRRYDSADPDYQRSAAGDALHAARAAYDRGNCSFSEACAEEGTADPALLEQAVQHYEACLALEDTTPPVGSLFDDARHNLELAKLILAEFAKEGELKPDDQPPEPENKALAHNDDPSAPPNAAQPPESGTQDKPPDALAKADPKEQQDKASDAQPKGDANQQPPKECKRGGCPKCKKNPGTKPGEQQSAKRGDGPKPTPGNADNGTSPGKGKGKADSPHTDPGGGKGKPGQGGKPSATDKNGVGDAKESGTGPADPGQAAKKKGQPSEGKAVGPDGVGYEKQDQPSPGATAGEGNGPSAGSKPPQPGGKDGSPRGAAGDGGHAPDAKDQPPAADVDKLFKPGTSQPNGRQDGGAGGAMSGQGRTGTGQAGSGFDADLTDGSGDPVERAAARRLRQAVQRIRKSRDSRLPPPGAAKGAAPGSDRRRDW